MDRGEGCNRFSMACKRDHQVLCSWKKPGAHIISCHTLQCIITVLPIDVLSMQHGRLDR